VLQRYVIGCKASYLGICIHNKSCIWKRWQLT